MEPDPRIKYGNLEGCETCKERIEDHGTAGEVYYHCRLATSISRPLCNPEYAELIALGERYNPPTTTSADTPQTLAYNPAWSAWAGWIDPGTRTTITFNCPWCWNTMIYIHDHYGGCGHWECPNQACPGKQHYSPCYCQPGWICPRCNRSNAPSVTQCPCSDYYCTPMPSASTPQKEDNNAN